MTIITQGQSLFDVAVQELGSLEGVFDLAGAAGLAITDLLTPGQVLPVPASAAGLPEVAAYFRGRAQRVNTGAEVAATTSPTMHDYKPLDYSASDFL